jgi:hypothetical protein
MSPSCHQNSEQNLDMKIGNRWFENVSQFRYLGTTITIQIPIQEEIERRLNSGNAYYHWVQNLLSSRLYGCATSSLALREQHRLSVTENRVSRRIFGPKGNEMT